MESNQNKITFSANNVYKYFMNQTPYKGTKLFTDTNFPPNTYSLHALNLDGSFIDKIDGSSKASKIDANIIEWKRASEIFSEYKIFDNKIENSDIKQGNLGNCYFLSSLSGLAEFPHLISKLFKSQSVSANGCYEIVLFIEGEWQTVILDDYFPVKAGTNKLRFAQPIGSEIWVLLLEKAWAKINHGYANIVTGKPSDPLSVLTGFPTSRLLTDDFKNKEQELWSHLRNFDKNEYIMCVTPNPESNGSNFGLINSHIYTLVGAKESRYEGDLIQLIQIRNPWGHTEWTGDWSDNSDKWNYGLKKIFDMQSGNDGSFFMSFEDFCKYWSTVTVCHVMPNSQIKSFEITKNVISKPQVFNLFLDKKSEVGISINRKHWRFNRDMRGKSYPFSIVVAKYDDELKLSEVCGSNSQIDDVNFVQMLEKGNYVVWVYCAYDKFEDSKFDNYFVRFVSSALFKVKLQSYDENFELIKEMIGSGVMENYSKNELFNKADNCFGNTGLAYHFCYNENNSQIVQWSVDCSKIKSIFLLPPYENQQNCEYVVEQNSFNILLGMIVNQDDYWFKIYADFSTTKTKIIQKESSTSKNKLKPFLSNEFLDTVYDYVYYNSKNNLGTTLDDLKSQFPELMYFVLDLTESENEENLIWTQQSTEEGLYIGQFDSNSNNKQGRGALSFANDKTTFVGHWENGVKVGYAQLLDHNMKPLYEGYYENNLKHGSGEYFYANGDHFLGMWENDKWHGDGVLTWANGEKWEGLFENGVMNGCGVFKSKDGKKYEVTYVNGQKV